MSQQYALTVINRSSNAGDICIYQTPPAGMLNGIKSLAWLTKHSAPNTAVTFEWCLDHSFMWDGPGSLKSGTVFDASQVWPADLNSQNMVTLHYDKAYTFQNLTFDPRSAGSLVVKQDYSIPLNRGSVGIGMSGASTFAVPAQPNTTLVFTPHPVYWVTFGNYTKGQVLDTEVTNAAQIAFPPDVYAMTAVRSPDNSWTVGPSVSG